MLVMMIEIKRMIIMGLKDQTSDDDNNGEGSTQDLWSPTGEANSQPVAMSAGII